MSETNYEEWWLYGIISERASSHPDMEMRKKCSEVISTVRMKEVENEKGMALLCVDKGIIRKDVLHLFEEGIDFEDWLVYRGLRGMNNPHAFRLIKKASEGKFKTQAQMLHEAKKLFPRAYKKSSPFE